MNNKIFLIAGHTKDSGEGAQNLDTKETENDIVEELFKDISEETKKELSISICPLGFTLAKKIEWVNNQAKDNDIVLSCHLDSSVGRKEKGAICYYYGGSTSSKNGAIKILDTYCKNTGLKNNGVKPDTSSNFGRLGIIRDTKGFAFLLELGSINNDIQTVKEKSLFGLLNVIRVLQNKPEEDYLLNGNTNNVENVKIEQFPEWSKDGREWCENNGIITKFDGLPVTDYRLATILHNLVKYLK